MTLNNPLPRHNLVRYHEGNSKRSVRDGDGVGNTWRKNKVDSYQVNTITRTIALMQRDMAKLKRRIVGGASQTVKSTGGTYKGEYDAAAVYKAQDIVTRGILGEFVCVLDAPAGTAPETGAPYWHAWQVPPPGVWQ